MTGENQNKITYLRRYLAAKSRVIECQNRLEKLRAESEGVRAINYERADMPKAHNTEHDLSDVFAKIDQMEQLWVSRMAEAKLTQLEVDAAINALSAPDPVRTELLQRLLRQRYIDGDTWEQIALNLSYTWRQTINIHGEALHYFRIPS